MMKVIICTKYGPPEVLQMREVEKPSPKDDEVLIKIHATAVTVGDTRIRGFSVPLTFWIPARIALGIWKPKKDILGSVFAGEIVIIGKEVKQFIKGNKIFASSSHNLGAYSEYLCIAESGCVAIKPVHLTYEEAAAIPWGGLAALYFLRKANIRKGRRVLIYGASGSLGTSAVQLAKYFGAEVIGVCSTSNINLVKQLGADKVIDYTKEDFTKNSETYDVIFDTVGKNSISKGVTSLKKNGVYLHSVATPFVNILMKWFSIISGKKLFGGTLIPKAEDLIYLKGLVELGHLKPVIDRCYSMGEIVEAHRYVDKGHKKGNVVIKIN